VAEKALTAVVISTRSVDDLVRAMGMEGISKSQVSRRHCQLKQAWHASSVGGAVAQCGKSLARL
jgi:putative transposase